MESYKTEVWHIQKKIVANLEISEYEPVYKNIPTMTTSISTKLPKIFRNKQKQRSGNIGSSSHSIVTLTHSPRWHRGFVSMEEAATKKKKSQCIFHEFFIFIFIQVRGSKFRSTLGSILLLQGERRWPCFSWTESGYFFKAHPREKRDDHWKDCDNNGRRIAVKATAHLGVQGGLLY